MENRAPVPGKYLDKQCYYNCVTQKYDNYTIPKYKANDVELEKNSQSDIRKAKRVN